jgi:hypothetical protein
MTEQEAAVVAAEAFFEPGAGEAAAPEEGADSEETSAPAEKN